MLADGDVQLTVKNVTRKCKLSKHIKLMKHEDMNLYSFSFSTSSTIHTQFLLLESNLKLVARLNKHV